jgi:DNA primase catalytic subunit
VDIIKSAQMAAFSEEYQILNELLVNLEQEHRHLLASIEHLSNNVIKRELEIRKLLADRELESLRTAAKETTNATNIKTTGRIAKSQSVDFDKISRSNQTTGVNFSSEYSKQVSQLLDKITSISEEVSALVRL